MMNKNTPMINKKLLRKNSYSLNPVVIIGQNGLTDAFLSEIDPSLNAHELIKIRIRETNKKNEMNNVYKFKKNWELK